MLWILKDKRSKEDKIELLMFKINLNPIDLLERKNKNKKWKKKSQKNRKL